MNPSASGWIRKLLSEISEDDFFLNQSKNVFYQKLKHCGFIYGSNVAIVDNIVPKKDLTDEELCKANLILTFFPVFDTGSPKLKKFS